MSPVGDQQHSFVAILVAARCNVREVSEWAGLNNVAFTLTRYGLFEDGSDEAVDRLDSLLGGADPASAEVVELRRAEDLNPCCPLWPLAREASTHLVTSVCAGGSEDRRGGPKWT